MPKVSDIAKCKHPNSRKTKALAKQIKKQKSRDKSKMAGNIKLNLLGEKLLWFKEQIETKCTPEDTVCCPHQLKMWITLYISRFSKELEQIEIKHSIGNRKNRQHASREDIIKLTQKSESQEFYGCGLEIPDLLDPQQFKLLREWNGELRFLQNFKLKRYSTKILDKEYEKSLKNNNSEMSE